MNGLLIVDKPSGKSSHGVVAAVRRMTGEQRVGHAGTLDPMATGVLVVCVGQAVRVSEYLVDHDKRYRARVRLGVETDTYDATGETVAVHPVDVTPDQVRKALESFSGAIAQMPPAHSAVQKDGVRAYQLARRGVEVELEPRQVTIYSLALLSIDLPGIEFEVHCSKGTYIRSLAHDLGSKLGTGGHLAALRRLASGPFTIEQSHTLEELTVAASQGRLADLLLPMDLALKQFPRLELDEARARAVRNGQLLPAPPGLTGELICAYDERGRVIALLDIVGGKLKPKKVFSPEP